MVYCPLGSLFSVQECETEWLYSDTKNIQKAWKIVFLGFLFLSSTDVEEDGNLHG